MKIHPTFPTNATCIINVQGANFGLTLNRHRHYDWIISIVLTRMGRSWLPFVMLVLVAVFPVVIAALILGLDVQSMNSSLSYAVGLLPL